jgi:hypothetical protein
LARASEHRRENTKPTWRDGRVQGQRSSCRGNKDTITIGTGKDEIDLYYFRPWPHRGDTFVVFKQLRTIRRRHLRVEALPMSTRAMAVASCSREVAKKTVATVKNVDTIINGHITVSTWNDLKNAQFTSNSPRSPRRR